MAEEWVQFFDCRANRQVHLVNVKQRDRSALHLDKYAVFEREWNVLACTAMGANIDDRFTGLARPAPDEFGKAFGADQKESRNVSAVLFECRSDYQVEHPA